MLLNARTWKDKCYAVDALRGLAGVSIAIGLVAVGLATAPRFANVGGYNALSWMGTTLVVIGIVALLGRKTTAMLFALESAVYAGLFLVPCFKVAPHPAMIFSILMSASCLLPVLYTVRGWEALK